MFMNVPGLKIVVPASPYDAKGLLRTAIDTDDPVLIFEACMLWGMKEDVPEEEYHIRFGEARTVRSGTDLTVVAISSAVPEAAAAADALLDEQGSVRGCHRPSNPGSARRRDHHRFRAANRSAGCGRSSPPDL